jgi:hypothetical protein
MTFFIDNTAPAGPIFIDEDRSVLPLAADVAAFIAGLVNRSQFAASGGP